MPIKGSGWELHVVRQSVQKRPSDGKKRTVGTYQVFHEGVAQTGPGLKGMIAESHGPGANKPAENGKRVEAGAYALSTQAGTKFVTIGYKDSNATNASPKPGFELNKTGERTEILVHPGNGFLSSIGCLNLCTSLPDGKEKIDYIGSRQRVISVIDDMLSFLGDEFPKTNGKKIPKAHVVIDGEP